ncbi:uncharacterized protein LOC132736224 [Ruditapes philippinarum]|uniref:uncharacterized protein LOC132736224 n=1 Tax=Ruditapes philippinarum TaxID=129788 RepID=UPI00295AB5AE|nr:uncharacterized protein LOC132736224 [Ruditapes philippinarum]
MSEAPDYTEAASLKLSEVLADIGVNTRMILKRRRAMLLIESMRNMSSYIGLNMMRQYIMGSQAEGTTTLGLNSDTDMIVCPNMYFHVIQDWSDWQPGVINLLMIQDHSISPGYCQLQLLRPEEPLPFPECGIMLSTLSDFIRTDRIGRICFRNSFLTRSALSFDGVVRHGPACSSVEDDVVFAFTSSTWPLQARQWLHQQSVGQWPTDEIKQYCCSSGCFLVGVGGQHGSENEDLEWRISTCIAEKCLMYNLNITQIRCYVLMKMIIKTFINPLFNGVISSYMCKTVLFHCIEGTQSIIWQENNLIVCLSLCIHDLYTNIFNENCPHFFIPENNLMRGKITPEVKPFILDILQRFINSNGVALLGIKCDDLGSRLQLKFNNILVCPFRTYDDISKKLLTNLSGIFLSDITIYMILNMEPVQISNMLKQAISDLVSLQCHGLDKTARNLLAPMVCSRLGSVLASLDIQQYNTISAETLKWISLGLNTDVASSKLKLASMLYCTGQFRRAEIVLCDIERHYDLKIVEPICPHLDIRAQAFNAGCDLQIEEAMKCTVANCVQFWPCEVYCSPKELRPEMFRSTEEDKAFRTLQDFWMNNAEVDSLTFLYFLQYKIYSHLNKQEDKCVALSKLTRTIEQEPRLAHSETALNLLGQCMEQEHRPINALQCYSLSLNIRWRNNAAKIHICRLLSTLINNR